MELRSRTRAFFLFVVFALAGRTAVADESAGATATGGQRLGLVVAGGVSEGSYQAGATYVLMRYRLIQRESGGPELSIATGASAGNINVVLASTFWLDRDALAKTSVLCNVFHDTWVAVGWDRLAPLVNDWGSYRRLFDRTLPCLNVERPLDPGRPHGDSDPVYTNEDGLVTREGLLDVLTNARVRVDGGLANARTRWRRAPPISLGITITKETVDDLRLDLVNKVAPSPESAALCPPGHGPGLCVRTQREVLPFRIGAPAATASDNHLRIETVDGGWPGRHPEIGSVLRLVPPCSPIDDDHLFTAVKAAKGFPIAFGPLRMQGDKVGPRFWDGGWFDNVPVGLAIAIDQDLGDRVAAPSCGPPLRASAPVAALPRLDLMYVDAGTPRVPGAPSASGLKRGVSYLANVLQARLDEGRNYELQRIARLLGRLDKDQLTSQLKIADALALHTTDRYFALTAEELPLAFGAFLSEDFRSYDYLIGVYDGLFAVALERLNGGGAGSAAPRIADSNRFTADDWTAFVREFRGGLDAVVCDPTGPSCKDPDASFVRDFVVRLLREEVQERAPATVVFSIPLPAARVRPDDPVWHLFDVIDQYRRQGHNDASTFEALLRHLPKKEAVFSPEERVNPSEDPSGFWVEAGDQLARRAIDVERADRARGGLTPGEARLSGGVESTLQLGRMALVSFEERSRPSFAFELDDSSSARRFGVDPLVSLLLPYYVATQLTSCTRELGWEPKVRSRWGWGADSAPQWQAGFFIAGQVTLQETLGCVTQKDEFTARFGLGLGYDPAGRIVDNIQLVPVFAFPHGDGQPDTKGVELAATFLTKLRLAVGSQTLWSSRGDPVWYVSLGVADLGGLLAWGLDRAMGCESRPTGNSSECEARAP